MAYNDPLRDLTREMIDKMYEKGTKRIIKEEIDQKTELDQEEQDEEESKFMSTVSPRVKFKKILIYPKTGNVEWAGKFTGFDLEWVYSLDNDYRVSISTKSNLVRLDDSMMEILKKLSGYYETWSNYWANKIAKDYKSEDEESETED